MNNYSRRQFIRTMGVATAGAVLASPAARAADSFINPSATATPGQKPAGEKVRLACVGIANRGEQIIGDFDRTGLADIVALCDVDLNSDGARKVIAAHPKAKIFKDFRELFDKFGKEFDAVSVAIPDFAHFAVAMLAISQGKHVYVEKPMARTFYECELMMDMARRHPNVVTQVGNQGHSEANYFQFKAWQEAGIIKDIYAITAHFNNWRRWYPYDPAITKYPEAQPIPEGMDYDTWLMNSKFHEFNEKYHPGNWRGWYDFGMGAIGDWGAHILDSAHEFLQLGLPYEVNPLKVVGHNDFFFPMETTVLYRFGARGNMPPVDVTWYDGENNQPPLPDGYYDTATSVGNVPTTNVSGQQREAVLGPGKIIYGKDITFKGGTHGGTLSIIPKAKAQEMAGKLPEVPKSPSNHFANFLNACMGKEKTRSNFEVFGPMCQTFALGVVAMRLNTKLTFDNVSKTVINNRFANALLAGDPPRKGWEEFYKL